MNPAFSQKSVITKNSVSNKMRDSEKRFCDYKAILSCLLENLRLYVIWEQAANTRDLWLNIVALIP